MKRARTSFFVPLLVVVAVVAAFLPEAAVSSVTDPIGGFRPAACVLVAALAFVIGLLEGRIVALQVKVEGMVDTINRQLYGDDYEVIRNAVSILVVTVKKDGEGKAVARRELERLTGQAFGDDGEAWATWWEKSRPTFRTLKSKDLGPKKSV